MVKGRRAYLRAAVVVVALGAAAAAAQLRARARGHGPERPRRPYHTGSKLVLPVLAGVGCQSPGRTGSIRRAVVDLLTRVRAAALGHC